jgi:DNA repair protein RadC
METNIQIREVQVSYQPLKGKLFQVKSADNAFEYLSTAYDESTIGLYEEFMVLLLNRANRVIGCLKLSKGGLTGTVVDLRILFGTALKAMASSIIVAHNHPSNNLVPSQEDRDLTRKIKDAGKLLDIHLLDHLILGTDDNFISFANEGWL